ncbi:MAG: hypothetical protein K5Q68_20110 [Roseococcus sp.]|nr:hypothetical protein [Roseococcus sp.]
MPRWTLIAALVFATPALAQDRAAAERCAAGLQPMGQQIFMRALPGVLGGGSVSDSLRSAAASVALSAAMNRDTARQAAEAASQCLALAKPG